MPCKYTKKNVASSQHYRSPLKAYTNNQSCRPPVYANQTISLHSLVRQIDGGKTKTLNLAQMPQKLNWSLER